MVKKNKHGGRRKNAGRKKKEPTETMRLPSAMRQLVKDLIKEYKKTGTIYKLF